MEPRTIRFDDEISAGYRDATPCKYLYRILDTGELVEVEMAFGEQLERQTIGGYLKISKNIEAVRALAEEFERDGMATRSTSRRQTRAKWPLRSVNAGVNPSQVKELRQFWREHDVHGCEIRRNGDVVYESRGARRADHAARGLFDRDGGYGDQAPQNL